MREKQEESKEIKPRFKKPSWLRVKLPVGENYKKVRKQTEELFFKI